jgi:hypothetical protein
MTTCRHGLRPRPPVVLGIPPRVGRSSDLPGMVHGLPPWVVAEGEANHHPPGPSTRSNADVQLNSRLVVGLSPEHEYVVVASRPHDPPKDLHQPLL